MTAVNQRAPPLGNTLQRRLQEALRPTSPRAYALSCAIISLLLLSVLLIVYFLVQQGGALTRLIDAVREKEATSTQLSLLILQLQELRRNLTAMTGQA